MEEKLSFEVFLEKNGSLTYAPVGRSMLPLLREGKDLFIVQKKGIERCRLGDVILFHRPGGPFVLHRVVKVLPEGYDTLGDNSVFMERNVREAEVLGIMTGFVRNGKVHHTGEAGYQLYSTLWMGTRRLRVAWKRGKFWLARGRGLSQRGK